MTPAPFRNRVEVSAWKFVRCNSYRVDWNLSLVNQVLDLAGRVSTTVVSPVGNQKQCLAGLTGFLHFLQAQVDSIQHSRAPFGLGKSQSVLDLRSEERRVGKEC